MNIEFLVISVLAVIIIGTFACWLIIDYRAMKKKDNQVVPSHTVLQYNNYTGSNDIKKTTMDSVISTKKGELKQMTHPDIVTNKTTIAFMSLEKQDIAKAKAQEKLNKRIIEHKENDNKSNIRYIQTKSDEPELSLPDADDLSDMVKSIISNIDDNKHRSIDYSTPTNSHSHNHSSSHHDSGHSSHSSSYDSGSSFGGDSGDSGGSCGGSD